MSNEKLQRYFNSIVKVISDACTKPIRKQLCMLDAKNFEIFYTKFNQFTETDSPTLYNLVQLFYVIEDLKKITAKSPELTSFFSQRFNNSQIFFNTIFNSTPAIQTYIEVLKKLHVFEETVTMDLLISLGDNFRKALITFQNLQNPSWGLIEQFKIQLEKFNQTPELKTHFVPIINLINAASPKQSQAAPAATPIPKPFAAFSQ